MNSKWGRKLDKLGISSILLVIIDIVAIAFGIYYISTPRTPPYQENFIGMTHEEIAEINPNLAQLMLNCFKVIGGTFISFGILGIHVALKSYRKGEKWAWCGMSIAHLIFLLPIAVTTYSIGAQQLFLLMLVLLIVFFVAIALPAKKVFG